MAQFIVLAYDGTDLDAPARRRAARPAHFDGIGPMVERGELLAAGAILDDAGQMIGSALFTDFPSRSELDSWLDRDPYVKEKVWQRIEVRRFRLAVLEGRSRHDAQRAWHAVTTGSVQARVSMADRLTSRPKLNCGASLGADLATWPKNAPNAVSPPYWPLMSPATRG